MSRKIAQALADFNQSQLMTEVEQALNEGQDPMGLVRELQAGMNLIGERFKTGNYFLSELILSSRFFTKAMELLEPHLTGAVEPTLGTMVIGTPKGDIHDIGKNIFATVAKGAGFEVHDLGVDVPVDRFVEAVMEVKPQIVGLSALITPAFQPMKEIVDTIIEAGLREKLKIVIGGGVTTETVRKHVGADAQTTDAIEGLNLCKELAGH